MSFEWFDELLSWAGAQPEDLRIQIIAAFSQAVASILALLALLFSIWTFLRQIKLARWELRIYREAEVIEWTKSCLLILSTIEEHISESRRGEEWDLKSENKIENLSRLTALIDQGRLFFPNHNSFFDTTSKPRAYRGARQAILDPLVACYDALKKSPPLPASEMVDGLRKSRREFVSYAQKYVDPNRFNRLRG